ncbi:MAG TPA: glycosyltransferase family 2 protein [Sedimentisphaerales bacterium]|nr:glycosyltransferase family 2 protein [Sedimentisphaerales bacterium]
MELKSTERSTNRYLGNHLLSTMVYLFVVLTPGLMYPRYYALVGTIVFVLIVFFSARCYLQAFFAVRMPPLDEPSGELPRVSLIVPSYNEETVLERSLSSMLALDYPADKLEFIYVYESLSADRTEEIIHEFARRDPRIKPVRRITCKGGKAAATNYGLRFATGEIIAIFDADHALDSGLVWYAVAQLQHRSVGCVRGRCRTVNRTLNLLTRLIALERDAVERFYIYGAWRMGGFSTFTGGHAFFRREIFDELGLFREDILTEDIDFSVKLHAAGYEVVVLPQIQSWEEVPISLKTLMHQRKRWTRGWMQIWRLHAIPILREKRVSLFKRVDIFLSLTSTVASGLVLAVLPLACLRLLGWATSCFGEPTAFGLWVFVSTTPAITTVWAWLLDRREKGPPPVSDLLVVPLLIPYIFFLFGVSWICFADEFLWQWPFAYVKTPRAKDALRLDMLQGSPS